MKKIMLGMLVSLMLVGCSSEEGGDDDDDVVDDCTVDDSCEEQAIAFRTTEMTLQDPPMYFQGLIDISDAVNNSIKSSIEWDDEDDPDGFLDLSIVTVFRPLDQASAETPVEVVFADCVTPMETTACTPNVERESVPSMATNMPAACIDIIEGTTSGGDPMTLPAGPCFVSGAEDFDVSLGDVLLGMVQGQVAADYSGDPADELVNGLIRGFVTEETAAMVRLPPDEPLVGGEPIINLLSDADKDVGPNGESGWWFYLTFTAEVVPWSDLE